MRDEDSIKQAFEAQASSADESRELCDIFGLDSGGRHDDRRDRLLSLLSGPSSRRRIGWLAVFAGQLAPGGSADASDRGEDDPVAIEQRVRAALLRDPTVLRDGRDHSGKLGYTLTTAR